MASGKTGNLGLPQFAPGDKPTWQGDVNRTNKVIDREFGRIHAILNRLATNIDNINGGGSGEYVDNGDGTVTIR